jgi:hypothetical protein
LKDKLNHSKIAIDERQTHPLSNHLANTSRTRSTYLAFSKQGSQIHVQKQSKDIPEDDTSLAYSIELNQTYGPELLVCATISLVLGVWVMVISVRARLFGFFLFFTLNALHTVILYC